MSITGWHVLSLLVVDTDVYECDHSNNTRTSLCELHVFLLLSNKPISMLREHMYCFITSCLEHVGANLLVTR